MQIHDLKRKNPNKKSIKVGRGGKRGKTSGQGHKGQKSRASGSPRPEIRDMIKRLPKLRGRGVNANKSVTANAQGVSLMDLEANFKAGDRVLPSLLLKKGLIKKERGLMPTVKILGNGELTKKLIVKNCQTTKTAKDAIEKAGGEIK